MYVCMHVCMNVCMYACILPKCSKLRGAEPPNFACLLNIHQGRFKSFIELLHIVEVPVFKIPYKDVAMAMPKVCQNELEKGQLKQLKISLREWTKRPTQED